MHSVSVINSLTVYSHLCSVLNFSFHVFYNLAKILSKKIFTPDFKTQDKRHQVSATKCLLITHNLFYMLNVKIFASQVVYQ